MEGEYLFKKVINVLLSCKDEKALYFSEILKPDMPCHLSCNQSQVVVKFLS